MATLAFEIELTLDGYVTPYRPAQTYGPAEHCYPAEGGEVEDLGIRDAGVIEAVRGQHNARTGWKTTSFLTGVDRKNPEVQKLLTNLLNLVWDKAEEALIEDAA